MKNIIALILCVIGLFACDSTFDNLGGFNNAPTIYFNGSNSLTALEGSVKTSLKHGSGKFEFVINAVDPEKQNVTVNYSFASGNGRIFVGNNEQTGTIAFEGGSASVEFRAVDIGEVVINFTASDKLGASTTGTLKLNVFVNLPPVATFTWSNKKLDGPYYVEFDASGSIDKDQDSGGGIQLYRYTIKKNGTDGSEVINTDKTIVPYNLRGPGGYDITLEVFDNDGAKSDPFKPAIANQVTVN